MNTLFPLSLNRTQLKIIAVITMTLDHIGAALIPKQLLLYSVLRLIGRIAFPIFCFLLVEGFFYTKNREKYIMRLLIFALIAEIPFDFGLYLTSSSFTYKLAFAHQNTLFTLAIGMITMTILEKYKDRIPSYSMPALFICMISLLLAQACGTDYGMFGVFFIISLYYRKTLFNFTNPFLSLLICFLPLMATGGKEPFCIISLFLIYAYNPAYCKGNKYFFYIYYPLHLTVLAILRFIN